jgi:1,4-dihydroxy-2-naphthoyl-CoA hydrolase
MPATPASIWKTTPDIAAINRLTAQTAGERLGIEFTAFGDDWLSARMPVDRRTHQPAGLLHGGASVLLAETVGSLATWLCIDMESQQGVGLDINANHLRGVRSGWVTATAKPIHLGRTTHVWEIRIVDEADKLVCIARLTMSILSANPAAAVRPV